MRPELACLQGRAAGRLQTCAAAVRLGARCALWVLQRKDTHATHLILSFFVAARLPVLVQAAPYGFALSGDQFVQMLSHPHPMTDQQYAEREQAYSYLVGVKDAEAWCPEQPSKTFELAYGGADFIKSLPADLRKSSAARLLLTYLSGVHPCQEGKR